MGDSETLFIRLELRRSNPNWEKVPIDVVCAKHNEGGQVSNCIMAARGEELTGRYYNETSSDLLYQCDNLLGCDGSLTATVAFWFPCTQSCLNSSTYTVSKEEARDSFLSVQLVKRTANDIRTVLDEFTVDLWIRSAINKTYFNQTERRKPKGAAAQMAKKRKVEEPVVKTELEYEMFKHLWFEQGRKMFTENKLTLAEIIEHIVQPDAP